MVDAVDAYELRKQQEDKLKKKERVGLGNVPDVDPLSEYEKRRKRRFGEPKQKNELEEFKNDGTFFRCTSTRDERYVEPEPESFGSRIRRGEPEAVREYNEGVIDYNLLVFGIAVVSFIIGAVLWMR